MRRIATEGRQQIQGILDREMMRDYQWDKTDADVKQAVADKILARVKEASGKDKTFTDEFERLKARSDWAGLSRHLKNFQERVTPGLIPSVARLFAVKSKVAPVAAKKPVVMNGKPAEATGWVQISQQPKAAQIDYGKMGRGAEDMLLENKAILKDGRRVTWAVIRASGVRAPGNANRSGSCDDAPRSILSRICNLDRNTAVWLVQDRALENTQHTSSGLGILLPFKIKVVALWQVEDPVAAEHISTDAVL